jgi:hypothetical protein
VVYSGNSDVMVGAAPISAVAERIAVMTLGYSEAIFVSVISSAVD